MVERNLNVDHVTIWRPGPKICTELRTTNRSWRVDETYLRVAGKWTGRRCRCRPVRYLNNVVEQDHRSIKRPVRACQGFRSFTSAARNDSGYRGLFELTRIG